MGQDGGQRVTETHTGGGKEGWPQIGGLLSRQIDAVAAIAAPIPQQPPTGL